MQTYDNIFSIILSPAPNKKETKTNIQSYTQTTIIKQSKNNKNWIEIFDLKNNTTEKRWKV